MYISLYQLLGIGIVAALLIAAAYAKGRNDEYQGFVKWRMKSDTKQTGN